MPLGSNPMPPSIFMSARSFSFAPLPLLLPLLRLLLVLTAQELLQLGGDLVARGHFLHAHGIALGGIDALLQLAHHRLVLLVVGDKLVHLAPGAVGRPA